MLAKRVIYRHRIKLDWCLSSGTKINSKFIKDLNLHLVAKTAVLNLWVMIPWGRRLNNVFIRVANRRSCISDISVKIQNSSDKNDFMVGVTITCLKGCSIRNMESQWPRRKWGTFFKTMGR